MNPSVATFLPLWAGTPSHDRAQRLIELLTQPDAFWPEYPVPSVPVRAAAYQEARYWKGPTWVNMNWAIIEGLRSAGADGSAGATELADRLRDRTLELVGTSGFSEYFSALTGAGYGADEFSWTAALAIDLALNG